MDFLSFTAVVTTLRFVFGLAFAFFADFGLGLILGFAFGFDIDLVLGVALGVALGMALGVVFFAAGFLAAFVFEVVGAFLAAVVVLPVWALGRDTGLVVAYARRRIDVRKLAWVTSSDDFQESKVW